MYREIRASRGPIRPAPRYREHMEEHPALLRLVRAVAVLDGVDAEPTADGVPTVGGADPGIIGWAEIADLLGADDPLDRAPRLRLAVLLLLHRQLATLGSGAAEALHDAARPLALPVGHPLHPGHDWAREPVPGGVLELGVGVAGLVPGQDVLPLPGPVAVAAGLRGDDEADWRRIRALGDGVGEHALARLRATEDHGAVLIGSGGIDALTLLALPAARDQVAGPVAVPARDRAWLGARATDESFLRAVWVLTGVARRGVAEPLAVGPRGVAPLRPAQRSGSSPIGS